MIRSSACLSANDISVRCRVRKSPFTANPSFHEAMEMTCTMRHWQPDSEGPSHHDSVSNASSPSHVSSGPELILMKVDVVSPVRRDSSPNPALRVASRSHERPKNSEPVHIPLSDISTIEAIDPTWQRKSMDNSQRGNCLTMKITTQKDGFYEFDSLTRNSRDVLLAFLRANVAPERLVVTEHAADDRSCPSTASTSSARSLDVDRFTEEKMKGASERERWSDKIARRLARVTTSVSELASSVCDTACCRSARDVTAAEILEEAGPSKENTTTPSSSRRLQLSRGNLEVDDSVSVMSSLTQKKQMRDNYEMPSGLSFEPDTPSVASSKVSGSGSNHRIEGSTEKQRRKFRESLKQFNMPSGLSVEREEDYES